MKKLYSLLTLLLAFAICAQAKTYNFTFYVDEPDLVSISVADEPYEIVKGENKFTYNAEGWSAVYLDIVPAEGYILKLKDENGANDFSVMGNKLSKVLGFYDFNSPDIVDYTRTVVLIKEEEYYDKTVNITFDNPTAVYYTLRGNNSVYPTEDQTEIALPYNSEFEDKITFKAKNYGERIYKVVVDGKEISTKDDYYEVNLVDTTDANNPVYVENIVITKEYPADFSYTVKIKCEAGADAFTSVTCAHQPVENFMAEEGFKVRPGQEVVITYNKNLYLFSSYTCNGEEFSIGSYSSEVSKNIFEDVEYVFNATKLQTLNATFVCSKPELISVKTYSYPYVEAIFNDGKAEVQFTNKDSSSNCFEVSCTNSQYEITRIYDKTQDKEYTISSTTYVYLVENSEVIIDVEEIIRDKKVILYLDQLVDNYGYSISVNRSGSSLTAESGYNFIDFRDKDYIGISYYNYEYAKIYRDDIDQKHESMYSASINNIKHNEVIKVFFDPAHAVEHTVTFDVKDNALDGFEVKKDIVADVDPSEPVFAVGKTRFTIAPVSRADEKIVITIGENTIEPENGVYTFETEADTTVAVKPSGTTGIDNITNGGEIVSDIYNLQGICVARKATADKLNQLPAGIYIFNGTKITVK